MRWPRRRIFTLAQVRPLYEASLLFGLFKQLTTFWSLPWQSRWRITAIDFITFSFFLFTMDHSNTKTQAFSVRCSLFCRARIPSNDHWIPIIWNLQNRWSVSKQCEQLIGLVHLHSPEYIVIKMVKLVNYLLGNRKNLGFPFGVGPLWWHGINRICTSSTFG